MAISITHPFSSAKADGADATVVQPSDWNAAHTMTCAADSLIGRGSGAGAVQEIACTTAGRALLDDAAASDQRTTLGLGTAATQATGTSGATIPFLNGTNTWANAQTFTAAPVFTNQSGSRTALGLGTSATQNTGTSGANVPLLNGNNTHSGTNTFSSTTTVTVSTGVAARNTVKAFGKVLNSALQSGSFNVTSITVNATSIDVNFTTGMANTDYAVILTGDGSNENASYIINYRTISTGSFNVSAAIPGNGNLLIDSFSFMVLSNE